MEAVIGKITIEKYPAYKDSGVEWLGAVPENWQVSRLGKILSPTSIKNHAELPLLSITREKGVILRDDDIEENHNFIPDDLSNYKVLREGEFGMNKMKAWQGSYGVSPITGIVSPAYYTFIADPNIVPEFFHVAIRSKLYVSYFASASDGVRVGQWDLSKERMKDIPFLIPPKKEQTTIANFLDRKTAQIDKAIAQKQRQIELLKERRQILIHRAVTRGLDADVRMKDSGVEWIGEVPEHWEVRRSKFLFTQRKERARDGDVQLSATQAYGVIPQEEYESKIERRVVKIQFHLDKRKHVEVDDFVISMRSFEGGLERAWSSGCIRSSYVVLRPLEEIDPGFYSYLFKSSKYISALQATASFIRDGQDLNFENFSMVDLYMPPLSEQKTIAKYLDAQIERTIKSIEFAQSQIERLREYKATLINAAVTGKIKVS